MSRNATFYFDIKHLAAYKNRNMQNAAIQSQAAFQQQRQREYISISISNIVIAAAVTHNTDIHTVFARTSYFPYMFPHALFRYIHTPHGLL